MSSARVRQLRQYLALQDEIARRLNRPIDLDQVSMDQEDARQQAMLDNQNSLIPLPEEVIASMFPTFDEPSLADRALTHAQRQSIQSRLQAQGDNSLLTGPMIASVTQLDR